MGCIPVNDIGKYKEIFAKYDTNGDGTLNAKELMLFLKEIKYLPHDEVEESINAFIVKYDKSKDGNININEFSAFLQNRVQK